MSKKAKLLIALAVILMVLAAFYTINYYTTAQNTGETPSQNPPEPPETPERPQFVIPESPLGTLGLISALAAGFGMFTIIMKKRR